MKHALLSIATAVGAGTLVLASAGSAAAAQNPNDNATCLGKGFQAQAVATPQTVSNRILEIRALLDGLPFGQALQPLALGEACA